MTRAVVIGMSALAGAVVLAFAAETNTLLAILMGSMLGATVAIAAYAFPLDLDYRETRVWPPREP